MKATGVCEWLTATWCCLSAADRVIARDVEDFTQHDQRYDVVFDAVGKSSFGRCRRLLTPRGVFLWTDLGPGGQNPFLALVTPWLPGRSVLFGYPRHDQAMVDEFKDLMEAGRFRPVIDRSYPLAEIVDAYRFVETGQKIGNVVITVDH